MHPQQQVQVILFEIDCTIFYKNLHELFCQFINWTNWVNSGKFMDNYWISCQVMIDMEKFYYDFIIINLSLPKNSFGKIVLALTFHIFIKKHLSKEKYTSRIKSKLIFWCNCIEPDTFHILGHAQIWRVLVFSSVDHQLLKN